MLLANVIEFLVLKLLRNIFVQKSLPTKTAEASKITKVPM